MIKILFNLTSKTKMLNIIINSERHAFETHLECLGSMLKYGETSDLIKNCQLKYFFSQSFNLLCNFSVYLRGL